MSIFSLSDDHPVTRFHLLPRTTMNSLSQPSVSQQASLSTLPQRWAADPAAGSVDLTQSYSHSQLTYTCPVRSVYCSEALKSEQTKPTNPAIHACMQLRFFNDWFMPWPNLWPLWLLLIWEREREKRNFFGSFKRWNPLALDQWIGSCIALHACILDPSAKLAPLHATVSSDSGRIQLHILIPSSLQLNRSALARLILTREGLEGIEED